VSIYFHSALFKISKAKLYVLPFLLLCLVTYSFSFSYKFLSDSEYKPRDYILKDISEKLNPIQISSLSVILGSQRSDIHEACITLAGKTFSFVVIHSECSNDMSFIAIIPRNENATYAMDNLATAFPFSHGNNSQNDKQDTKNQFFKAIVSPQFFSAIITSPQIPFSEFLMFLFSIQPEGHPPQSQ